MAIRIIKVTGRIRDLCSQAALVVLGVVLLPSLRPQALESRLLDMQEQLQRLGLSIATQNAFRGSVDQNIRGFYQIKTQVDKISVSAWNTDFGATTATGASSSLMIPGEVEEEDLVLLQPVPKLVFGLDSLTKRLQELVLQSEFNGESYGCVGVWGPGWAGKTLLAQVVHNSTEIQNHFGSGFVHWLTIGRNPSIHALYSTLSKSIVRVTEHSVDTSIEDFKRQLFWFWFCFGKASRTKTKVVHAFGGVENVPEELQGFARSIAKECKGLPLALKVIGGAMVGKRTPHEWKAVLSKLKNSHMPDVNAERELFERLELSYDDLQKVDPRSKHCFLYFAAFREDAFVEQEDLFRLWICDKMVGDDPMDDAYYLVGLLIGRSLIEFCFSSDQGSSRCKIHDVLRDLALHILERNRPEHERDSLFRTGRDLKELPREWMTGNNSCSPTLAARRISLMGNQLTTLPPKLRASCLHTLLLRGNPIQVLPGRLLSDLGNLMVLDLSKNLQRKSLPNSIGILELLVYLNLSRTSIKKLPDSVSNHKSLEIIDLSYCTRLQCLPVGITDLRSLKFLYLTQCVIATADGGMWKRQGLPVCNLISRPMTLISRASLEDVCQLSSLQELSVSCFDFDLPMPTALSRLVKFRQLTIKNFRRCRSLPAEMQSLAELETIVLSYFDNLVRLPDWITSFVNLKRLEVDNCANLSHIPALDALPQRMEVRLMRCESLKELPTSFTRAGAFPLLHTLEVNACSLLAFPALENGTMPKLVELDLFVNDYMKESVG
ncbi:hypothetical protein O6H91_03G094400 [Diphasiastrum complanatum]|uniref:Uncharacterized protein n=1 Tax=Diphasiastrum complanatum TaxID=34168 RepID=A0ACC2E8U5_DIPCM|nr:hypothetical protein O6H91_03G094400 [Diphasiastrum complanatum]